MHAAGGSGAGSSSLPPYLEKFPRSSPGELSIVRGAAGVSSPRSCPSAMHAAGGSGAGSSSLPPYLEKFPREVPLVIFHSEEGCRRTKTSLHFHELARCPGGGRWSQLSSSLFREVPLGSSPIELSTARGAADIPSPRCIFMSLHAAGGVGAGPSSLPPYLGKFPN
eukprot:gene31043-7136_t